MSDSDVSDYEFRDRQPTGVVSTWALEARILSLIMNGNSEFIYDSFSGTNFSYSRDSRSRFKLDFDGECITLTFTRGRYCKHKYKFTLARFEEIYKNVSRCILNIKKNIDNPELPTSASILKHFGPDFYLCVYTKGKHIIAAGLEHSTNEPDSVSDGTDQAYCETPSI